MKRWLVILFLFSFVSASVDVHNYTIDDSYSLSEKVKGEINLTIEGEDYDEVISFGDEEIGLGVFLEDNGVAFDCFPSDCSMGYEVSSGVVDKSFNVLSLQDKYVGFVLKGNNVVLDSVSFDVESDFGKSSLKPLIINFFEGMEWSFNVFSDELLPKDWGCYNPVNKKKGSLIGNSFYCEMINIQDSGTLRVGADVVGSGTAELEMVVYLESGSGASWDCSFDPSVVDGCDINPGIGSIFSAGNYQVCVGASSLTSYNIYEESGGESCGFAYDVGPANSSKDFGVFAQTVKYESASSLGTIGFGKEIVKAGNDIITERYGGDCSNDCVLPLKIFGVSQNMRIHNVSLIYTENSEWESSSLVYDLVKVPAKVDFSGVLDLSLLGFSVSKAENFIVKLGNDVLFKKMFSIFPAPIILSVLPSDSPAGVPVKFYAMVDFSENRSMVYKWNFGDNESATTDVPYVLHTYKNLGSYTLSLEVSAGGNLSSKKSFEIKAISPEEAVALGLISKKNAIRDVRLVIEGFPSWYGTALLGILEVVGFESDLERMDKARNSSFDAKDFRDIAIELYGLNIPILVGRDSFEFPFLMTASEDIKMGPVVAISGGESKDDSNYVNSVLNWQNENVVVNFLKKEVFALYWSGERRDVLNAYSFDVISKFDKESYFVINKPFNELYFNGNVGAQKAGDSTVIILAAGEKKSFEFYYEGGGDVGVFVSPKLSLLVLEADIDTSCNYDLICDEGAGENPDNCRSDCKPTGKAIFFLIFGVLFFLVVYTGLQIWYRKHYEGYLFQDGMQLYNMLMYVTNARARGMKDDRIVAELRAKGWSSERVNYVIRKSVGKSVGMIEIIPIERISAWLRNRQARNKVKLEAAIQVRQ